ncbi:MAG: dodecin domain-containing protein [Planctomycetes bacterium]|nr:dodecin domain-containing protein [Planctomycetota bacterium]
MAVARVTQIVSSSAKGIEEAMQEGLRRANKTLRGITGLELTKLNCKVENGKIVEYRVHMNVTFILED